MEVRPCSFTSHTQPSVDNYRKIPITLIVPRVGLYLAVRSGHGRYAMRGSVLVLLFLSVFACSASAARHEVHVQVRSVLSQRVRGVGVGVLVGGEFTTQVPCSRPYPSDTVSVVSGGAGSLDQCVLANPAHQPTGSVQNRRVEAILTTEDGQTYYVVLGCQKQYGWCAPLADRANYVGKLNDKPK